MESELGKSGLGLMPPVPTPQFQCPGLRRKPRASWSRTFRGGGAAGALGLGFLDPLSRKRHLRWGQVREGSLPEGSTLEQEGTGTGRSLRRRPAGAGAGRRGGARGGGGVQAEASVCGKEKGKGDAAGCGGARLGDRREGAASSPALSAEDGSDESSRGGHFLLGWMRRSRRRRGGDRTEDRPCRGEVSPGLAADSSGPTPKLRL